MFAGLMFALAMSIAAAVQAQTADQVPRLHGYTIVKPLQGVTHAEVRAAVAASSTIPMWDYSVVSPLDSKTYTGTMIGRSPYFHGLRTTNIPTFLVPLIINLPDGGVFDPTKADKNCLTAPNDVASTLMQQSPILTNASFTFGPTFVGDTQYIDAFQRGNFWNTNVVTTGNSYHTMLSPVTTLPAVTVNIPAGQGATYNAATMFGGCGNIGVMDNNTFDGILQNTVLPSLKSSGVGPTTLPLFLVYNVVQGVAGDSIGPSNCCILGYHNAVGAAVQVYGISDFDTTTIFTGGGSITSDTSVMAHEVGELTDDPLGTNPTPLWGNIGQVSGCQGNLENGDPLSGTVLPPVTQSNGFAYNLQELAFFSWFYRQTPPGLGVNGWFSNNGTFTAGQPSVC
ncbi:MAG TPA: hypothetical protein VKS22_12885 [Candidatus Binataceae bacterium]|nr:hypothetical protein [Candidatus Binataceae bacterium]